MKRIVDHCDLIGAFLLPIKSGVDGVLSATCCRLEWSFQASSTPFREGELVSSCDLRWVQGPVAAVGILHPPNPGRAKTRPFPRRRWRDACSKIHFNHPSKLACTSFLRGGRWLPAARFDEHRPSKNTMGLVCALGEQRKLPSLPIHYFAEPGSDSALRSHPSLSRGDHSPSPSLVWSSRSSKQESPSTTTLTPLFSIPSILLHTMAVLCTSSRPAAEMRCLRPVA